MIRKILVLLCITTFMLSCQQDDIYTHTGENENNIDGVPVKIGIGMGNLQYGTDYTAMTKAGNPDEIKVKISKLYRMVLMKEVEDKIIIDKIITRATDLTIRDWESSGYKEGESMSDTTLILTPGKYHITVFTGFKDLTENTNLKEGLIVADATKDGTETYAYTYGIGTTNYSNAGMDYIAEEIFTGYAEFEVKKTQDLHSPSDPALDDVKITLKRRVTKYRIILHDAPGQKPSNSFASNSAEPIIKAHLKAVQGKFVDGLDIWGNPWYNPVTERKEIEYCTECKSSMIPFPSGDRYYLSTHGARVNAPYFFSKEGDDVVVEISNIQALFGSNSRYYEYYGPPVTATFIHSNIDGFMLRPGTYTNESIWPPITEMEIETDNGLSIFNSYAEYNFLQNP